MTTGITETTAATSITFAAVLTAQPFGIPLESIAFGAAFCALGVLGRATWEMQKVAEGARGMTMANVLRWASAGFVGAPFISVLIIIGFKLLGAEINDYSLLGFVLIGFIGPQAVTALIDAVLKVARDKFGIKIPSAVEVDDGKK